MAVADKPRAANGRPSKRGFISRANRMPEGKGWAKRFARGLIRWREKKGLSAKAAAEKYGVEQTAWSRVERAVSSGLTGQRVDEICEAIRLDVIELIKLGEAE